MQGGCGIGVTPGATGGMRGWEMQGQLARRDLPQVPQPARSILGTQRWLRGVGGKEEKGSRLLLPLARGSPSTGSVPQPPWHCRTSTRGMPGWHSLVKPAAAEPQSRVWGLQGREAPAYPRGPRAEGDSSPRAPQSWAVPAVPGLWGWTRTSAGVSTAAPLPQPRSSHSQGSIPGASVPLPGPGTPLWGRQDPDPSGPGEGELMA